MGKFKVGDKVRFVQNFGTFEKGMVVKVIGNLELPTKAIKFEGVNKNGDFKSGDCYESRVELAEPKQNKNQRIKALEETVSKQGEEIAELKVIVHQLRTPSEQVVAATSIVEGAAGSFIGTIVSAFEQEGFAKNEQIIEFEGAQYRKVDRLAHEGDVIIYPKTHNDWHSGISENKPYLVYENRNKIYFDDNDNSRNNVYGTYVGFDDHESVKVYELIVVDKPKTANELRAEIIEKAKGFVANYSKGEQRVPWRNGEGQWFLQNFDFIINEAKRTVVVLCKSINGAVRERSIAKCNPSDVFNEHISKAIALGRALGLDVSEFEQVVQPTFAIGQKVHYKSPFMSGFEGYYEIKTFGYNGDIVSEGKVILDKKGAKIINDTNAIY